MPRLRRPPAILLISVIRDRLLMVRGRTEYRESLDIACGVLISGASRSSEGDGQLRLQPNCCATRASRFVRAELRLVLWYYQRTHGDAVPVGRVGGDARLRSQLFGRVAQLAEQVTLNH